MYSKSKKQYLLLISKFSRVCLGALILDALVLALLEIKLQ